MHMRQAAQRIQCHRCKQLAAVRNCTANRSKSHTVHSSSSCEAGPGPSNQQQQQDLVGGMLDYCISTSRRVTETAISRIADIVQSIAPPAAPREKIEVSVKGALFLLILGLLKGVLNFVLLIGSMGLAVYTATQVFGWNAVVLGQGSYQGPSQQQYQQQQSYQQQQQQRHPGGTGQTAADPGYQTGQAYQGWQQQQWPGGWQQQGPWSPWPMQPGQGDIVDVTRGQPK